MIGMSFVTTMVIEERTVDRPTWSEVETAIRSLDGRSTTLLVLSPGPPLGPPEGDAHLAIGGAADGRLVVYMTADNLEFWNLRDPARRTLEGASAVLVSGQVGEYKNSDLVDASLAVRAAQLYFERGLRNSELVWANG